MKTYNEDQSIKCNISMITLFNSVFPTLVEQFYSQIRKYYIIDNSKMLPPVKTLTTDLKQT